MVKDSVQIVNHCLKDGIIQSFCHCLSGQLIFCLLVRVIDSLFDRLIDWLCHFLHRELALPRETANTFAIPTSRQPWTRRTFAASSTTAATLYSACTCVSTSCSERLRFGRGRWWSFLSVPRFFSIIIRHFGLHFGAARYGALPLPRMDRLNWKRTAREFTPQKRGHLTQPGQRRQCIFISSFFFFTKSHFWICCCRIFTRSSSFLSPFILLNQHVENGTWKERDLDICLSLKTTFGHWLFDSLTSVFYW